MNVECSCKEWKEGRRQIDGIITFGWTHGIKYTGGPFKYCPWCGKPTVETKK